MNLYGLLRDEGTSVIIMDVRLADQYNASHISHDSCISVPQDIIAPG